MGALKKIFGTNKKVICDYEEDGSQTCKVVDENNEDVSSVVNFSMDPRNCKAIPHHIEVAEGDEERVKKMLDASEKSCKRGLA